MGVDGDLPIACGCNQRSGDRSYRGMDSIPGVINHRNLVGNKIEQSKQYQSRNTPVRNNKCKVWIHFVEMKETRSDGKYEHGLVIITAISKLQLTMESA